MPVDVEVIAAVVAACPSVARLYPGRAAEVATYLPGRRVEGVRVADDELEVHVVAAWDVALPQVADEVRGVATPLSEGLPVAVYIDDVDIPPELLGVEEPPEEPLAPVSAPLPAETPLTTAGTAGLGTTAPPEVPVVPLPGEPVPPLPGEPVPPPPGDPLPADPGVDPLAPDPVTRAGMLPTPPEPAAPPTAPGDPAADVLPGEVLPDDVVLEDEVPGDVIPGEPVTPPPASERSRKKRTPKRGSGGSK